MAMSQNPDTVELAVICDFTGPDLASDRSAELCELFKTVVKNRWPNVTIISAESGDSAHDFLRVSAVINDEKSMRYSYSWGRGAQTQSLAEQVAYASDGPLSEALLHQLFTRSLQRVDLSF